MLELNIRVSQIPLAMVVGRLYVAKLFHSYCVILYTTNYCNKPKQWRSQNLKMPGTVEHPNSNSWSVFLRCYS